MKFRDNCRKHSLQSPSSVQNALNTLLADQILTYRQENGKITWMS